MGEGRPSRRRPKGGRWGNERPALSASEGGRLYTRGIRRVQADAAARRPDLSQAPLLRVRAPQLPTWRHHSGHTAAHSVCVCDTVFRPRPAVLANINRKPRQTRRPAVLGAAPRLGQVASGSLITDMSAEFLVRSTRRGLPQPLGREVVPQVGHGVPRPVLRGLRLGAGLSMAPRSVGGGPGQVRGRSPAAAGRQRSASHAGGASRRLPPASRAERSTSGVPRTGRGLNGIPKNPQCAAIRPAARRLSSHALPAT